MLKSERGEPPVGFGAEGHGPFDLIRAVMALAVIALSILVLLPVQALSNLLNIGLARRIPVLFHRIVCKALGLRILVRGDPPAHRPTLYVSNHVSWTDILVLGSLGPVSFVARADIAGWPLFGMLAKLQRTIFVNREKRTDTGRATSVMAARLKEGDPVVLFAEGTTSDGNRVLPFRAALVGAAEAHARETGETVWVQPIALAYTRLNGLPAGRQHRPRLSWAGDIDLVPHAWPLLMDGAMDVEVVFGNPVAFDPDHERKAATRFLHARVSAMHAAALTMRRDDLPAVTRRL